MIRLHNLSLSFGTQAIIDNLSLSIPTNATYGLVGRNGSGKSTLLELIAGAATADHGSIAISRDIKIAYLPQDVVLKSQKTVLEEALYTDQELYHLLQTQQELEQKIEILTPKTMDPSIVDRYSQIQQSLIDKDADKFIAKAKQILYGLGFTPERCKQMVEQLSVGWKMRLVLAKLLLTDAGFYLFDEPTNHLDLGAKEWFLHFLKQASFGFLLVCHERYFLDELCSHILALDRGNSKLYTGNYTAYERQHAADKEAQEKTYAQQQKEIQQKMKTIERFRYKANKAKMAQSMIKKLDKMEKITVAHDAPTMRLSFPSVAKSGREVLTVRNVGYAFGAKEIFRNVSFTIERGQKVALIGPNGQGKTTLFNVINGKLPVQTGSIEEGYNVISSLFEQDQDKVLTPNNTILEEIAGATAAGSMPRARALLGAFLFDGDTTQKKIKVLSGGEKNRVAMVKTLLQNANFLMLDEPTNHLDIQSKEILARALREYPGTMLFVSHDRDFLNEIATHVVELTPNGVHWYIGNYDDYSHLKATHITHDAQSSKTTAQKKKTAAAPQKKAKPCKELHSIEQEIAKVEKEVAQHETTLSTLSYEDEKFAITTNKLADCQKKCEKLLEKWEKLEEETI